ncbi:cysteine-rich receptor-like protein kinase, partial [Trifolium medium]|nr:cysteine-rich receptor-like protein kinase [Trifolium medium]
PLSVKYRRLFDLSLHKSSTVAAMQDLGWEVGGAAWSWRRQLPDSGGGYTVRGAYNLLTSTEAQDVEATTDLIWHKQVPLKVSVVAWWLLCNRLRGSGNSTSFVSLLPGVRILVELDQSLGWHILS